MNKQELDPTAPGHAEVVNHLRELYPREHPDALGWILWNYTCFPFPEGSDPFAHWVKQVDDYLALQQQLAAAQERIAALEAELARCLANEAELERDR